MEEPLTKDEAEAIAARVTKVLNDQDPMPSENVNARRKADKEYQEEVAQAAARRNDRIRATGVSLPEDIHSPQDIKCAVLRIASDVYLHIHMIICI